MTTTDFADQDTLDELGEIVAEMLDGIADTLEPGLVVQQVSGFEGKVVQAELAIVGLSSVPFVVRVPMSSALGLASALTGAGSDELDETDACETVEELTNVLGGSIKYLIEEETHLDVPTSKVVGEDAMVPLVRGVKVDHQLGTVEVQLGS